MTSQMEKALFNLKFTSKQLQSQSKRAAKSVNKEKLKLKKAIQQGNADVAKVYAENAIRYKNQSVNYLKLSSRIDAVAARVEQAIRMQQVSRSMAGVVKGMDKAMKTMDTEKITQVMEQFEQHFEDVDVQTQYMDESMSETTMLSTPAGEVDTLIQEVADEHGLELQEQLGFTKPQQELEPEAAVAKQDELTARLEKLKG